MTRVLAAALVAMAATLSGTGTASRCSSLNGPFCAGVGVQFALETPLYASKDLDQEVGRVALSCCFRRQSDLLLECCTATIQTDDQAEISKRVKIENVLKQYELQEAASQDQEIDIYVDVEMLLEEGAVLLGELDNEQDSPLAGAFAFSSEGGAFELLEKMDGHELKVEQELLSYLLTASTSALTPYIHSYRTFSSWRWTRCSSRWR